MKILAFLLAMSILALSTMPCSDGQNFEDQQHEDISVDHSHQEDSDDSCPITCICNCCGISIAYEPLTAYEIVTFNKISTQLIPTYQSNYRFDFLSNIWQPPQVIN